MHKTHEGSPLCQGRLCKNFTVKTIAFKVCHHKDCQSSNNGQPLLLCLDCDRVTHAGVSKTHARFEIKGNEGFEKMSSSKIAESDSGAEDDIAPPSTEKSKTKAQSGRRKFMKLTTDSSKKKPRRHNTDDPGREFIRLKIYTGTPEDFNLELIPALKGKTLKDSLEPILEKYNITFESHSLFLDSSNTPLPLAFETFPLSGSILHVRDHSNVDKRVKDISKNFESKAQPEHPVSRTPSFGKKREEKDQAVKQDEKESDDTAKKGKKSGASTPVDNEAVSAGTFSGNSVTSNSQKVKPPGILTGLFTGNPTAVIKGKELTSARSLPEILEYFTVYGLENDSKITSSNEQQFYLEDSWTEVVENYEDLSKSVRDQQEAIWELLSTEVAYINKLQVIKKIFILCLRNIQNKGYLAEIDLTNLFSNIEEIYAVNVSFWLSTLKPVMNMARHTKKLLNPFYMADGFSTFDSKFEPYLKYCMEESSCTKYFKQKQSEDELFKLYVEWCENRPECKRLKLCDLLVKPMQRLTKYQLLLKAILKKTVDEAKRKEITSMILTVQKFVSKVDASMKIRHEKENLNKAAIRIESYWPVDPVSDEVEKLLIDNYCDFDLSRAMPGGSDDQHRCLLYSGPLRLNEKQGRMDIHAFLFTDVLLLTKAKKMDKFKIVKAPLRIDKVKVHVLKDPGMFLLVYLNEYRTVVCAYVLQAPAASGQAKWIEMIDKAKNLYRAVLQSDGSRCLTADDADVQSPGATPCQSPTMKHKRNSWRTSNEFLDVPSSPRLRRHLSGSDGNIAIAGLSESSRSSGVIRRASYNERKAKLKLDNLHRRSRADSKIIRSTSDPHNKPAREDVLHSGRLSRSSSAKQSSTITESELQVLTETSVDLESPRSTTSITEVDFAESVDMDEIHMSLSPEAEHARDVSPNDLTDGARSRESGKSTLSGVSEKESSDKLRLLLAQKSSKASNSKDAEKDEDSPTSPRENPKRSTRSHGERKRVPRSSSVDRARKVGERRLAMDAGLVETVASASIMTSEVKIADGRKSKLSRSSSSGNRQLPDPSQISGKSRSLPKASLNVEESENVDGGQSNGAEASGNLSKHSKNDASAISQDAADPSEHLRSGVGPQAPPIKAPLIAGLPLTRNGSSGTDVSRKRNQLPKRSSPVLYRKSPEVLRKSMDDQLLEPKYSPPVRRAKSEADAPVESLHQKSKHSERAHSRNSDTAEHSRNAEGKKSINTHEHSKSQATSIPRHSEDSRNAEGKNSKNCSKTRSRARRSSIDHETTRRPSDGDDVISGSKKLIDLSQDGNMSNSTNSVVQEDTSVTSPGDKPRRQMKKYRGRDHRKLAEADGKLSSGSLGQVLEPFMLESSEYV